MKVILVMNLGSPDSTRVADVRRYLWQFLMDRRVLDIPWVQRVFVVGLILLSRPQKSAEAYRQVWMAEGSPLVVHSRRFVDKLQGKVSFPVRLGMRYGSPSIASAVAGASELVVIPMYPHYAMSSYETAVAEVQRVFRGPMRVVPPFFQDAGYIGALVESMRASLAGGYEYVLFSYHGLPERQLKKVDPTGAHCLSEGCCDRVSAAHATCYRYQVYRTTALVVAALGIPQDKFSVSFQSRLGRTPWIQPFTDVVLEELAAKGVRRLHVVSPAFVADCLETLEELQIRAREQFIAAGGEDLIYIPCLNEDDGWVDVVAGWVNALPDVVLQRSLV